jgi:hypothetical protein
VRGWFYFLGFFNALNTLARSNWNDGQIYSQKDELYQAIARPK